MCATVGAAAGQSTKRACTCSQELGGLPKDLITRWWDVRQSALHAYGDGALRVETRRRGAGAIHLLRRGGLLRRRRQALDPRRQILGERTRASSLPYCPPSPSASAYSAGEQDAQEMWAGRGYDRKAGSDGARATRTSNSCRSLKRSLRCPACLHHLPLGGRWHTERRSGGFSGPGPVRRYA